MTLPVAPELFDVLSQYAKDIEQGRVEPGSEGATSPALTFCQNFYAQFFQNRMARPIQRFNDQALKTAVRLRLEVKAQNGSKVIIRPFLHARRHQSSAASFRSPDRRRSACLQKQTRLADRHT